MVIRVGRLFWILYEEIEILEKKEIQKIISYLCAAYPKSDWGKQPDMTLRIWEDVLLTFPYSAAQTASKEYILGGNKYFPVLAEFVKLADKVWELEMEQNKRADREADMAAYRKIFHEPVSGFAQGYVRDSVELIRAVHAHEVKFGSAEWCMRYMEIYGVGVDPMTGV
jgi:hypothetical protein